MEEAHVGRPICRRARRTPGRRCCRLEEEAIVVAFRRHTLLPLDDCLYALQPTIPHLTRSSLHRCLQRHGISRLPEVEGEKSAKRKFKAYPIGYFHIDIAEVRTEQGKLYLFVAIDRTSKFAFVELHEKATDARRRRLPAAISSQPFPTRSIPCSPTTAPTSPIPRRELVASAEIKDCIEPGELFRATPSNSPAPSDDIDHRLTKPKHPWTNGQVERMNRTIKDATVKRYYYETHDELRTHLADFVTAYNFARRLKTLKGLTPYEFICKRLDKRARTIHPQSAPPNAGTKHLEPL